MKRTELKRTGGIKSKRAKPRTSKTVRCSRRQCSRSVVVGGLCKTHVIDKLDSIVRHRAYEEIGHCTNCGTDRNMQWSHHLSRKHMHIRWDERNYTVHCAGCHVFFTHNSSLHTEWIQQHVGPKTYAWLMDQAHGPFVDEKRAGTPQFKTSDLIEWWERLGA